LEINHHSDLPARSGVGSSSAFTVGLIHSILALEGKPISKFDLANLAIDLECNVLKENVGWQDQVACAIGGINAISFHAQSGWANKPISFQEEYRREFESKIVIAYTGVERISSNVTLGLLENLEKKKQHMYELIEMANVADSILSSQGNLDDLGILLNESWKVKRLMNNQASTSIIDSFYEEGIRCGASGGKILGAGGGGFFLFWIPSGNRERFIREFKFGPLVDITISYEGTSLIQ
jgi:D-glycero-alpha-D-manno-heptose-7-phosphate kinase